MPVISRFHGITIKMYLRQKEHNPPHLHAIYSNNVGLFDIQTGEMFEGDLPQKQLQMVSAFVRQNSAKLMEMWNTQQYELLPWGV